jgi:hypothetical protein
MNRHMAVAVIAMLCFGLFCSYPALTNRAQAQGKAAPVGEKITGLNPPGIPPPVSLKPMPPRLTTLEGKTIYVIDQGYLGTDNLLKEMMVWLEREYTHTAFEHHRDGRLEQQLLQYWRTGVYPEPPD